MDYTFYSYRYINTYYKTKFIMYLCMFSYLSIYLFIYSKLLSQSHLNSNYLTQKLVNKL